MKALDLALFDWIAAGYHPIAWLLPLMSAIAVGGPWICVVLAGWAAWHRPSERSYLMAVLVAAAAMAIIAHAIAQALGTPRPFMLGLSPAYVHHGDRGSMPSAHASVMFTVALVCLLRPGLRKLGAGLMAVTLATGWARIYVGLHFPSDIAAGLLLALVMVGVFAAIQMASRHHHRPAVHAEASSSTGK